jgi:UDP-N-acetylmuramate dehydrogenase
MKPSNPPKFLSPVLQEHVPLRNLNTIKIGGTAWYYAAPTTPSELKAILDFSSDRNLQFYILGNGSNVLLSDEDFKGIVIKLSGTFREIAFYTDDAIVTAGAGARLIELGNKIAERGYTGCAYMGVIPGTVGGAVRMNAGTLEEGEIKDHFLNAKVLDPQAGELETYALKDMQFEYRKCALSQSRKILLQVKFRLPQAKEKHAGEAQAILNSLLAMRRLKHPKIPLNFGSTFKRPSGGKPPGWYLEQVGMKGMKCGGAMVAEEHANWILNLGNAISTDVKCLISEGQRRVFEKFGISLAREVIYIPEDMTDWT